GNGHMDFEKLKLRPYDAMGLYETIGLYETMGSYDFVLTMTALLHFSGSAITRQSKISENGSVMVTQNYADDADNEDKNKDN
ncbi:23744_t:CDS:2, partial [Cetraspora pellucida]